MVSLYDITIPVFIRALRTNSALLAKAQAWADAQAIPHADLLTRRIAPDMYPLTFQIQSISNSSKAVPMRVGGLDPVPMEDNETTFQQLQDRITRTIDLLEKVPHDCMDGKEDKEVIIKAGPLDMKFTAKSYILEFALPNFWFHHSMTYAILKNAGVPLGKMDFLGAKKK
eukprot:TRINITY_DN12008_c0_g1_i2.p2 TRINITY_DN12008_c0_g1~~TRINITY_DN12008_c0_g1_i2.p2  ORF type:complete len:185 (+),score=62.43 TRINITY_DN12008_c0_g1_i2:46-555(+)